MLALQIALRVIIGIAAASAASAAEALQACRNAGFQFDMPQNLHLMQRRSEGLKAARPLDQGTSGLARILHIMNFSDTLKEEVERLPKIAISFDLGEHTGGCPSHFYHMIMNAALPLYAKMVRPFVEEGLQPPRRTVYVNTMGGTAEMLGDVIPEFDFVYEPWVPQCCSGECFPKDSDALATLPVPWFTLHSDRIVGLNISWSTFDADYVQLVWDFRAHILGWAPVAADGPLKHVYISRREKATVDVEIGDKVDPCDRRCLNSMDERQLIRSMKDDVAGLQVAYLSSMPFAEQVRLFRGSSLALGVHGASFVHCLWMPHNSSVIEIDSSDPYFFKWLCRDILKLDHHLYLAKGPQQDLAINVSSFRTEYEDLLQ